MSAPAGAASIQPGPRRRRPRDRQSLNEQEVTDHAAQHRTGHSQAPDDFYEALIDTHRDLTLEQSQVVNAKLVLLLANHIGDLDVLRDALKRARDGL